MKVREMLNILLGMSPRKIEVRIDQKLLRPSDVTLQILSTKKFRKQTGWEPQIPIDKTLEDLLNYGRRKISF